jgi:Fusaric acid resistance protein-like
VAEGTKGSAPARGMTRIMGQLEKIFQVNRQGINLTRGLWVTGVLLVPLVVLAILGQEKYWLSMSFAILSVALMDPGGAYQHRLRAMAGVGLVGVPLTALGFSIGGGPWGVVVLAAVIVTLLAGLSMKFGLHGMTAGLLLNSWFLIAISVPASEHLTPAHSGWWQQALAWAIGAALWIGLTLVVWVVRGRQAQDSHLPEVPGDMSATTLTRPVILFAVIRAVAIGIAVGIAFGLHLPNADWMPIATLVAMKASLGQATFAAEQRIVGAFIGALVATLSLLAVDNKHALEVVIVILGAFAATFRAANYTIYCAGVAAAVLIADDLPNPTNLGAEARRVAFTFLGLGIGLVVLVLAGVMQKRMAARAVSPAV